MRIKVKGDLADYVDKLFKEKVLIVDDGQRSHSLSRELRSLRVDGKLSIGYDRQKRKTLFVLEMEQKKKKRKDHKSWDRSVFSW